MKHIKYYWKRICKYILTILIGKKVRQDNRIRQSLHSIFAPYDIADEIEIPDYIARLPELGICKVDVKRTNNSIHLQIHLTRPGLLIGKGGRSIDYVTDRLTKWHDISVTIGITEVDPFTVRL